MVDKFIYKEGRIKISYDGCSNDEHSLYIGPKHFILPKGTIQEFALASLHGIMSGLDHLNPDIDKALQNEKTSYEMLGRAIAQTRVKELEYKVDYGRSMREEFLKVHSSSNVVGITDEGR